MTLAASPIPVPRPRPPAQVGGSGTRGVRTHPASEPRSSSSSVGVTACRHRACRLVLAGLLLVGTLLPAAALCSVGVTAGWHSVRRTGLSFAAHGDLLLGYVTVEIVAPTWLTRERRPRRQKKSAVLGAGVSPCRSEPLELVSRGWGATPGLHGMLHRCSTAAGAGSTWASIADQSSASSG
jgi:hypothetical protein